LISPPVFRVIFAKTAAAPDLQGCRRAVAIARFAGVLKTGSIVSAGPRKAAL